MKKLILSTTIAIAALIGLGMFDGILLNTVAQTEEPLQTLRDKKIRTTDPMKLVRVIEEIKEVNPDIITALVDLLDWERPKKSAVVRGVVNGKEQDLYIGDHKSSESYYPAPFALAKFKETLPALVGVLETEPPITLKWKNALWAVRRSFEYEDINVANFLRASQAKSESGRQQLNLAADEALEIRKKIDEIKLRDAQKPPGT